MRGVVVRARLALAVIVCGCGVEAVDEDAGEQERDAGARDAGHDRLDSGADASSPDAASDADRVCVPGDTRVCTCSSNAGVQVCVAGGGGYGPCVCEVGPDAGPPGECDLYAQTGCGPGEACRRPREGGVYGPPRCEPAGHLDERDFDCDEGAGPDRIDLCEAGLFCVPADFCVRYCDPANPVCPPVGGTPANEWGCLDCTSMPPHCGRLSTCD